MTAQELAQRGLVLTLNRTTEEVSALFDADGNAIEGAEDTIKGWAEELTKSQSESRKKAIQQAKDSGLRQSGEAWEKRIKALGIDLGDSTGDEAAEKIRAHMETIGTQGKAVDPKDEQAVKNSAFYRKMEQEYLQKHAQLNKDHEAELTKIKSGYQRNETLRTVKQDIEALAAEMKAILPDDPKVKANQWRLVDLDLDGTHFERDGETWILKDKEGNVIEGANGAAIKYKDFLKDIVEKNFPIAKSDAKHSAGDITKGSKTSGASGYALKKPLNETEYGQEIQRIRNDASLTREERTKLQSQLVELYSGVGA